MKPSLQADNCFQVLGVRQSLPATIWMYECLDYSEGEDAAVGDEMLSKRKASEDREQRRAAGHSRGNEARERLLTGLSVTTSIWRPGHQGRDMKVQETVWFHQYFRF